LLRLKKIGWKQNGNLSHKTLAKHPNITERVLASVEKMVMAGKVNGNAGGLFTYRFLKELSEGTEAAKDAIIADREQAEAKRSAELAKQAVERLEQSYEDFGSEKILATIPPEQLKALIAEKRARYADGDKIDADTNKAFRLDLARTWTKRRNHA